MGESHRLQSFAEDLAVFHQLTTAEQRAEFTGLMKRAYAQHLSACTFVQRSPERQVSARIRRLCEGLLSRNSTLPDPDSQDNSGGTSEAATSFAPQHQP
jgi:hypothetical protein